MLLGVGLWEETRNDRKLSKAMIAHVLKWRGTEKKKKNEMHKDVKILPQTVSDNSTLKMVYYFFEISFFHS